MKTNTYTLRFATPAFLGNADQTGQWRTPPIKALLRQWWRVAAARDLKFEVDALRREEGRLFGAANDDGGGSHQSRVRIRLERWDEGKLKKADWPGRGQEAVEHPEVRDRNTDKPRRVGAELYLGYGPLGFQGGVTVLAKARAAIQADEAAALRLAWPADEPRIADAIQLMHWFGTLGGRSRNGWGSFGLDGSGLEPLAPDHILLRRLALPLADCLTHDWPHALGKSADGQLLIWTSKKNYPDWRAAMVELAKAKIAFRCRFSFAGHAKGGSFSERHVISYPVTNHAIGGVSRDARLANQLRFKVVKTGDAFQARIVHLPCALAGALAGRVNTDAQTRVWQQVHASLDQPESAFIRL